MNGVRTLIKFLRPLDNIDFSLGSLKIQLFLSFFFFFFPLFVHFGRVHLSVSLIARNFQGENIYIYIFIWGIELYEKFLFFYRRNNCTSLLFPAERSSKAFHHSHRRFVEHHRVHNPSPIFDRTINRSKK